MATVAPVPVMRLRRASVPMMTGVSMLVPQAYEPSWTRVDDGVFNDYPPEAGGITPAPPATSLSQIVYDTTFGQIVPIPANVLLTVAILPANSKRGFLLLQNNSTAAAGGTAPTLYVAFDGPVSNTLPVGLNLAIPPGTGILFDRRVPSNAIFVAYAGGAGTFTAQGVAGQGLLP